MTDIQPPKKLLPSSRKSPDGAKDLSYFDELSVNPSTHRIISGERTCNQSHSKQLQRTVVSSSGNSKTNGAPESIDFDFGSLSPDSFPQSGSFNQLVPLGAGRKGCSSFPIIEESTIIGPDGKVMHGKTIQMKTVRRVVRTTRKDENGVITTTETMDDGGDNGAIDFPGTGGFDDELMPGMPVSSAVMEKLKSPTKGGYPDFPANGTGAPRSTSCFTGLDKFAKGDNILGNWPELAQNGGKLNGMQVALTGTNGNLELPPGCQAWSAGFEGQIDTEAPADNFQAMLVSQRSAFESAFPGLKKLRPGTTFFSFQAAGATAKQSSSTILPDGTRKTTESTAVAMTATRRMHTSFSTKDASLSQLAAGGPGRPQFGANNAAGDFFKSPAGFGGVANAMFSSGAAGSNALMQTTRAFLQFQGPKGGYAIKLESGSPDSESHQSEDEDDDTVSIAPSEFTEGETPPIRTDMTAENRLVPWTTKSAKPKDKTEKAYMAVQELVDTEKRYVQKLKLLDQIFRVKVESEASKLKVAEKELKKIFANVEVLHKMHCGLLLELEGRLQEWKVKQKVCDVMLKFAPYFKMYSEYTSNYETACSCYKKLVKSNKAFAAIVESIQKLKDCDNFPLETHLICPVQRITRYQLLLNEYMKSLPEGHHDTKDCQAAKEAIITAAGHANETMRKLDKYRNVVEVQDLIGGEVSLVTPARELVKQGKLTKISQRTGAHEPRYIFLFSDILLVCEERRGPLPVSKYKPTALMTLDGIQVLEGDSLETENTFYVRSGKTCMELYTKTSKEKCDWQTALWTTAEEFNERLKTFGDTDNTLKRNQCCSFCSSLFHPKNNKQYTCKGCEAMMCKKCAPRKLKLPGSKPSDKPSRVCNPCADRYFPNTNLASPDAASGSDSSSVSSAKAACKQELRRRSLQEVKAKDSCIFQGFLNIKTSANPKVWTRGWFAVHEDLVLYRFKDDGKATSATTALPMPGCTIALISKADSSLISAKDEFAFKLVHTPLKVYYLQASSQEDMAKWMTVLELSSKAELPCGDIKGA